MWDEIRASLNCLRLGADVGCGSDGLKCIDLWQCFVTVCDRMPDSYCLREATNEAYGGRTFQALRGHSTDISVRLNISTGIPRLSSKLLYRFSQRAGNVCYLEGLKDLHHSSGLVWRVSPDSKHSF